jgi:sugar lactone lactonase YvrE
MRNNGALPKKDSFFSGSLSNFGALKSNRLMKKIKSSLLVVALVILNLSVMAQSLSLKWTSDTTLRVPESVLVDAKNNVLYVANIDGKPDGKDGKGFISILTPDGKVKKRDWITGLDAPKGMGLYKNNLYVTDITNVAVIDITTGKVITRHEISGAQFLNDITVDGKGNVYISDSSTGKVHKLANGKIETYFENADVKSTNGVLSIGDAIYLADFQTGAFYKVDGAKKLTKIGETGKGGDGVVSVGKNEFIVSSWYGEIYYVDAAGKATKILDTKDKISSADVDYDPKTKTLYVPTFFTNTVMAYEFKK